MLKIFDMIRRIAPTPANVLIYGESGTGKELVAQAIHAHSKVAANPFVPITCSAIPEELMESELFGHVKGAFTGAISDKPGLFNEADTGTAFLDEIGELTPIIQTKLLRVLQEREIKPVGGTRIKRIDVRIIAATNRVLEEEILAGRFREDLFYRLAVVPLRVPPLRERKSDVPLLVDHFLKKYSRQLAQGGPGDLLLRPAGPDELQLPRQCPGTGEYHRTRAWPWRVRTSSCRKACPCLPASPRTNGGHSDDEPCRSSRPPPARRNSTTSAWKKSSPTSRNA